MAYGPATKIDSFYIALAYVATIPALPHLSDEDVWEAIGDQVNGDVTAHFAYEGAESDGTITYRGTLVASDGRVSGWHRDILASLVGTVCRCYCQCGDAHGGYCDDTDACNTPVATPDQITLTLDEIPGFKG